MSIPWVKIAPNSFVVTPRAHVESVMWKIVSMMERKAKVLTVIALIVNGISMHIDNINAESKRQCNSHGGITDAAKGAESSCATCAYNPPRRVTQLTHVTASSPGQTPVRLGVSLGKK